MNRKNTSFLLILAAAFAALKHRTQRRKDQEDTPYINHPLKAAEYLVLHGVDDPDTLAAALLHDTLEDTDTSPEELDEHFGVTIRRIVEEVSDDMALPKDRRKELQLKRAGQLSDNAKLVRIADKIANLDDMLHYPPAGWNSEKKHAYLQWSRAVVDQCRGVNTALDASYDVGFQAVLNTL